MGRRAQSTSHAVTGTSPVREPSPDPLEILPLISPTKSIVRMTSMEPERIEIVRSPGLAVSSNNGPNWSLNVTISGVNSEHSGTPVREKIQEIGWTPQRKRKTLDDESNSIDHIDSVQSGNTLDPEAPAFFRSSSTPVINMVSELPRPRKRRAVRKATPRKIATREQAVSILTERKENTINNGVASNESKSTGETVQMMAKEPALGQNVMDAKSSISSDKPSDALWSPVNINSDRIHKMELQQPNDIVTQWVERQSRDVKQAELSDIVDERRDSPPRTPLQIPMSTLGPDTPATIATAVSTLYSVPSTITNEVVQNPIYDPSWKREHWILLSQLHPTRMNPLPTKALIRPPKKIIDAFPLIPVQELAKRMLALDRVRYRRETRMTMQRGQRLTSENDKPSIYA
ncbi:hypothetical protein V1511DRAFT_513462 [Dipodascopsis uninucleata]